jgi:hypothetical protein
VRHDNQVTREPGPAEPNQPVVAINDRGLILGKDPTGRWIIWDQPDTAWLALDRLTALLPLLECPPDIVTATIADDTDQARLLPALLRHALTSSSSYWAGLALGWLEAGYPLAELTDTLHTMKDSPQQPQPLRHRALRLWRRAIIVQ